MSQHGLNRALQHVLEEEGGYVNDPKDPGGETKYGISKRAYPSEDIRNLTVVRAAELYTRDYWQRIRGDDLPAGVALILMDCAVNQGVGRAVQFLQRAVGVNQDGRIGPQTLTAVDDADELEVIKKIAALRVDHYLSMDNATEERFERGWIKRLMRTVMHATIVAKGGV